MLSGTIGAFASKYMHRERGFNRFFVLYAIFVLGMVIASLAGTIETLFTGWELVGLSSALLVAFFQERPAPARNGLWIWTIYRVSDAALLLAAVTMHHLRGEGDFDTLLGAGPWPVGHTTVAGSQAFLVGLLLLVAAAGKSALVPFSGWLPRAMEGPTPSSAVFYGALSVHLGAFLLLRVSPLLDHFDPALRRGGHPGADDGAATPISPGASRRTSSRPSPSPRSHRSGSSPQRSASGSVTYYIALVHMLGHACLRTLQFVRAPTVLQDYRVLENAIGTRLPRAGAPWVRRGGGSDHLWLYRLGTERGFLDSMLRVYVVALRPDLPVVRCPGTPLDRPPHRRRLARVGPGQAPLWNDRRVFMNILSLPWIELAIALTLIGSPCVSLLRDPNRAYRWGLAFTGASFACAFLAWLELRPEGPRRVVGASSLKCSSVGRLLALDEFPRPPLVPAIAPAPLPDRRGDRADAHATVLVLLVAGRRSHPAGDVQLQEGPWALICPPGRSRRSRPFVEPS